MAPAIVAAPVGGAGRPASIHVAVAPLTSSQACQGTRPLGLSGAWRCTFDDEFDGSALNTKQWVAQLTANSAYVAGPDCYVDNPGTVSVSGGHLNLSVRRVPPFTCADPAGNFTSDDEAGMVSTYGLFHQTYGAFEVNAKLPPSAISGLQETFWLYPQTLSYGGWPFSGEIDFAEFFSQYWGFDVPFIHYAKSSIDPNVTAYTCTLNQNTFNTYGVDWTPTSITVLYNGEVCLTSTILWAGAHRSTSHSSSLSPRPSASAPTPADRRRRRYRATTRVDWVRAWSAGLRIDRPRPRLTCNRRAA